MSRLVLRGGLVAEPRFERSIVCLARAQDGDLGEADDAADVVERRQAGLLELAVGRRAVNVRRGEEHNLRMDVVGCRLHGDGGAFVGLRGIVLPKHGLDGRQ